jgi:hypothetical protein
MRLALPALLIPAILPTQALAAPSPMFDIFQRVCLDTQGEPAAVGALTEDWTVVDNLPAPLLRSLGGPFDKVTSRTKPTTSDEEYMLVSGVHGADQRRTCTMTGPGDPEASAATRQWVGDLKPILGGGDSVSYLIFDTPAGRRAPTPEEANDAKNANRLTSVTVSTQMDVTLLSLSAFGH